MTVTRLAVPRGLNERFVRAFVSTGSGLDKRLVIPGQSDAPTPDGNFATVLLVSDNPDGRMFSYDVNTGDQRQYSQYRVANIRVQFITPILVSGQPSSVDYAIRFCMWVESDPGLIAAEGGLKSSGWPNGTEMRVEQPLSYQRIDGIEDEDWEQRSVINMVCRYAITYVDEDRRIDHAPVDLII